MKTLLLSLALGLVVVSCNKQDAGTELKQERQEAQKEYREDVNEATRERNEDMKDANVEYQEAREEQVEEAHDH